MQQKIILMLCAIIGMVISSCEKDGKDMPIYDHEVFINNSSYDLGFKFSYCCDKDTVLIVKRGETIVNPFFYDGKGHWGFMNKKTAIIFGDSIIQTESYDFKNFTAREEEKYNYYRYYTFTDDILFDIIKTMSEKGINPSKVE